eukprot:4736693-Pleurochrysis_carterae.AAC.1
MSSSSVFVGESAAPSSSSAAALSRPFGARSGGAKSASISTAAFMAASTATAEVSAGASVVLAYRMRVGIVLPSESMKEVSCAWASSSVGLRCLPLDFSLTWLQRHETRRRKVGGRGRGR